MATGWLIAPDIVVTAAHVAYDFGLTTQYGPASVIRAYMGYSGAANLNATDVQLRYGRTFITPAGWLQSAGQTERVDVAFLKLEKPFTGNFKVFNYVDTPLTGIAEYLGVVGYPADEVDSYGEYGAQMYQMFAPCTWYLDATVEHLLQYGISTYRGQSGSPVVRQSDGVTIGVHILGGNNLNSASSINGKYGNVFAAYIAAFGQTLSPIGNINGIVIIESASAGPDLLKLDSSGQPTGSNVGAESYIGNVMRSIGQVTLPVATTGLQFATPFLGPLGGPASAITSVALNTLNKATEPSLATGTKKGLVTVITPADLDGCAERAVLAESALQTVSKLDSRTPIGQQVLKDMAETYTSLRPLQALHSKLFSAIAGPTLRITLNKSITPTTTESSIPSRKALPNAVEVSFSSEPYATFAAALLTPTIPVPGTEAFFDRIAPIIQKVLKYASPMLRSAAQQSLAAALSALQGSTEASLQDSIPDAKMSAPLLQRALVAECSLQAVQKIDIAILQTLPLYDTQGNHLTSEKFFDSFKKTMQNIGPSIIGGIASDVVKNVGPIAINLVSGSLAKNSAAGRSGKDVSPSEPDPLPTGGHSKPVPIGS